MTMSKEVKQRIEKLARSKLPEIFIKQHIRVVVKEALDLCKYYPEADKEVVEIGAWLHDIGHNDLIKYSKEDYKAEVEHHTEGVKIAKKFLESINFDRGKIDKILHCIESHRTRKSPEPETIEAKIIASADNLAHFIEFDFMCDKLEFDVAYEKLERDLKANFMLPEALEKAKNLMEKIKEK